MHQIALQLGDFPNLLFHLRARRVIGPQQLSELDSAYLQVGAFLNGGFARVHVDFAELLRLLVGEFQRFPQAPTVEQTRQIAATGSSSTRASKRIAS